MSNPVRQAYLSAEVRTATPQRLRLLLIDGAIRFARQALEYWDQDDDREVRFVAIERCRKILTELYAAVKQDGSELNEQVAAIYLYLFRTLSEASMENDRQKINDVIEVLAEERTTWQQVCEQMPLAPTGGPENDNAQREITASGVVPISPFDIGGPSRGSFSLEV